MARQPLDKVKRETTVETATPRGQHDELFPDLPARPAPFQTLFRGSLWEKIHGAGEHLNTVCHAAVATDNNAAKATIQIQSPNLGLPTVSIQRTIPKGMGWSFQDFMGRLAEVACEVRPFSIYK